MFDDFIFTDNQAIQEDGLSTMFSQDKTDKEESMNTDLPTMPLSTILKSTDDFSDQHKLGKGGFGPVYKVVISDIRHDICLFDISLLSTFLLRNWEHVLGCFTRWKANRS